MDSNEYRFERINESLYKDLCFISLSAFGFDPGVSYYQQKNLTGEFGETNLGFIAYSLSGEPAAFYGIYSIQVEYNGKFYHAAQSGDTMTHKNHTGKGLFTKLAKMTYALAKEKGVEFVFGSPNANSLPGFVKKLDWVCPEKFNDYRFHTFTFPLAKFAKKFRFCNRLYKPYAGFILRQYKNEENCFNNSVLAKDIPGIRRSDAYFKYKSFSGCRIISIDGIATWIKVDGYLFIGDIDLGKDFNFDHYIKKLKGFCFWMGIDEIIFMTSPGTKVDQIFAAKMQARKGLYVGTVNLGSTLPLEKFKMVLGDVDTF
jgi:hypothetical protein